ncbi:MAG TPA: recombination mediator RecR [Bacteroidia bacterium]|nr:recombination mediator RecR [Bacteroidia bacterium]
MQPLPSKLLDSAVNEFSRLPGVGKKTALRLVLHLLRQPEADVHRFGDALMRLRSEIQYCGECGNIAESGLCSVCSDNRRDRSLVMVVEDLRDVMAVENTSQYKGLYHVLGGILSPMDGIGPDQLNVGRLTERLNTGTITEVIMALSTTMEGDTTVFYLYKKLAPFNVTITTIARGVAIGGELEYADEVTLGRSIVNRTLYESSLAR